jgi:hypothetical protein
MTKEQVSQAGLHVVSLFKEREFKKIEEKFGYAMSHGRPADKAIEEDFKNALDECDFSEDLETAKIKIEVSHFEPNSPQLKSLVECHFELSVENSILIELIISEPNHIFLEDISSYQTPSK